MFSFHWTSEIMNINQALVLWIFNLGLIVQTNYMGDLVYSLGRNKQIAFPNSWFKIVQPKIRKASGTLTGQDHIALKMSDFEIWHLEFTVHGTTWITTSITVNDYLNDVILS